MPLRITQTGSDVVLAVKVVPKSSRDRIIGELDGALKVAVSAAPEKGAANEAVCKLIARAFDMQAQQVQIESGHGSPRKIIRIRNVKIQVVESTLTSLISSSPDGRAD